MKAAPIIALTLTAVLALAGRAAAEGNRAAPEGDQATTVAGLPEPLRDVGFDQNLGDRLPLDATFRDAEGEMVTLARYFTGRPVILTLVYYECPMLCSLVLNGLTGALKAVPFTPGEDFEIVTISFDPDETPTLAAAKKASYVRDYGRGGAARGWHFLTGDPESIRAVTEAVGFHYGYDPETGEFAHASGIVVATPEGVLARYFYGVDYSPRDLRLGLVEASENRIGTFADQVLLYCFQYSPARGTYAATALGAVRLAGALTVLALVAYIITMLRRDRRRRGSIPSGATS